MAVVHPGIFQVIKRFPERREDILHVYNSSDAFRTACSDYRKCKEAFLYWSSLDSEESSVRREEYGELLHSLESEIINYLAEGGLPIEA
jgi:hypothetical protein